MATVFELDKIQGNPIKDGLGAFRRFFESTRAELGVAVSCLFNSCCRRYASHSWGYLLLMYIVCKNLVLDLTRALQIELAARTLPSRIAARTLSGDLAIIYGRVDSNELEIASAIPLVEQVVQNEPDLNIFGLLHLI